MDSRELSPKVLAAYQAVAELFMKGADLSNMTVSEITTQAGIGKGTVYDYFANKEDLIAGALYYEVKEVCRELYIQLCEKETLYDKIEMILYDMEWHMQEVGCAFKVLHITMDNSLVSKKIRQLFHEKEDEDMLIFDLLRKALEDEIGESSQATAEDMAYLVMNLTAKFMCYAMYLSEDESRRIPDSKTMRERLCHDICKEVESYRK